VPLSRCVSAEFESGPFMGQRLAVCPESGALEFFDGEPREEEVTFYEVSSSRLRVSCLTL